MAQLITFRAVQGAGAGGLRMSRLVTPDTLLRWHAPPAGGPGQVRRALFYRPRTGVSVSFPWACELGVLDSFTDLVRGVVHVLGRHVGEMTRRVVVGDLRVQGAVMDDRVTRGHGARGGRPVPAGA
jgi:hypothetical protein